MKQIRLFILLTLILFLLSSCGDEPELLGPYDVYHVRDGDTIEIIMEEYPTSGTSYADHEYLNDIDAYAVPIRLIGVNTEESVASDESRNTEFGKVASDNTKAILKGKEVYIEYDEELLDKYYRVLAYVYYEEGDEMVMLNEVLLETGMAETMCIFPNDRYEKEFEKLMEDAKKEELGMWR